MSLPKADAFQANPLGQAESITPAGQHRKITSRVICVRYDQSAVTPVLSVQREFNVGSGILRGRQDYAGRLMMDHIIGSRGQPLFGTQMRLGTVSVWEHQVRYLSQVGNDAKRIRAIVGNGNLTQNPFFVAWLGQDGLLIRLRHEPVTDRSYDCLVVGENGAVTVEIVRFEGAGSLEDEAGWRALDALSGKPLPSSTQVALSGQRIVRDGRPILRQQLEEQVISGLFYDLRHVFRFPAVRSGSYWRDLGLEQFYDHGSINTDVVAKALKRLPITTRWRALTNDENSVRTALCDKGYREAPADDSGPGTYSFSSDFVHITFSDAIYCHNVLGIDQEGSLCSMQVTGWSNNVGATLEGLSKLAANVFQEALLLDNGGDVFYLVNHDPGEKMIPYSRLANPDSTVVASCENRYFIRSVVLLTSGEVSNDGDIEVFKPSLAVN